MMSSDVCIVEGSSDEAEMVGGLRFYIVGPVGVWVYLGCFIMMYE